MEHTSVCTSATNVSIRFDQISIAFWIFDTLWKTTRKQPMPYTVYILISWMKWTIFTCTHVLRMGLHPFLQSFGFPVVYRIMNLAQTNFINNSFYCYDSMKFNGKHHWNSFSFQSYYEISPNTSECRGTITGQNNFARILQRGNIKNEPE